MKGVGFLHAAAALAVAVLAWAGAWPCVAAAKDASQGTSAETSTVTVAAKDPTRDSAKGAARGAAPAPAGATLAKIAATATISLGHRESSVPFSYDDGRHHVVGYSHELMLRVAEDVRAALKLDALTIRLVPLTSQNRLPLVVNGTVDLECGSTTHSTEREARVAFSTSIFVVGTRLLTATGSGIRDFDDLAGRRVVVTEGTTSERLLRQYDQAHGGRLRIVATRDHAESLRELESGRAAAFMLDDALLQGLRTKAADPQRWVVVGTPMSHEAYACVMRRDDPAFKRVVDASLTRQLRSGDALALYARWFEQPIPPRGINLRWPASEALRALYRAPDDRALDGPAEAIPSSR